MNERIPSNGTGPTPETHEQRAAIERLSNTILDALELSDQIEVNDVQPSQTETRLTVHSDLTKQIPNENVPDELRSNLGEEWSVEITYATQRIDKRPSLSVSFRGGPSYEHNTCHLSRSGEADPVNEGLEGTFLGRVGERLEATEYGYQLNSEAVAGLLQCLITPRGDIVFSDEGAMYHRLLSSLVLDPQHPPVARFIEDVLIEKGATAVKSQVYEFTIDSVHYTIRTITENGRAIQIDILSPVNSDPTDKQRKSGARISHANFNQAIEFFVSDETGNEVTLQSPDQGDLLRLHDIIEHIGSSLK